MTMSETNHLVDSNNMIMTDAEMLENLEYVASMGNDWVGGCNSILDNVIDSLRVRVEELPICQFCKSNSHVKPDIYLCTAHNMHIQKRDKDLEDFIRKIHKDKDHA